MARKWRRRRRRRSRIWDVLLTAVFFALIAGSVVLLDGYNPQELDGMAYVVDGDTLVINSQKLRLSGIDAPEFSQICKRKGKDWPCGKASRNALRKIIAGQGVTCTSGGFDKYDRWLAVCKVNGTDVNAAMVSNGWAVDYGGYASEEAKARKLKVGIWQGSFEVPEEWRRANRGDASGLRHGTQGWRALLQWWRSG